jgi:hypothetical protein
VTVGAVEESAGTSGFTARSLRFELGKSSRIFFLRNIAGHFHRTSEARKVST